MNRFPYEPITEGAYYNDDREAAAIAALLKHSEMMKGFIEDMTPERPYRKIRLVDLDYLSHGSTFLLRAFFSMRSGDPIRLEDACCLDLTNRHAFMSMLDAWLGTNT